MTLEWLLLRSFSQCTGFSRSRAFSFSRQTGFQPDLFARKTAQPLLFLEHGFLQQHFPKLDQRWREGNNQLWIHQYTTLTTWQSSFAMSS